jgi:hypothetical protein
MRWRVAWLAAALSCASLSAQTTRPVTFVWDVILGEPGVSAEIERNGAPASCPTLGEPGPLERSCTLTVPVGPASFRARMANEEGEWGPWGEPVTLTIPAVTPGAPPGPFVIQFHRFSEAEAPRMAASVETYAAPTIADFTSAGGNQDFTIDGGSGANRVMYVYFRWRSDRGHSIALTFNGVSLSAEGAQADDTLLGTTSAQLYRLVAPASGNNTLRFAIGAGSGNGYAAAHVVVVQDADQANPNDTVVHEVESGSDTGTTQDVSVSSAVDDLVLTFAAFFTGGNDTLGSVSGGSYTLLQQNQHGGTLARMTSGHAAGAATVTPATSYNNTNPWGALRLGVSINPVAGGTGGAARRRRLIAA